MMNVQLILEIKELLKLTYASIKLRCVKIIQKWVIAHIVPSVNLHTVKNNLIVLVKMLKKLIELRSVNLSGKKECAVTGFDVSFYIMNLNVTNRRISCKLHAICCVRLLQKPKVGLIQFYRNIGIDQKWIPYCFTHYLYLFSLAILHSSSIYSSISITADFVSI